MFRPDIEDPLKVRRNMALMSAVFAGIIWPHELIFLNLCCQLNVDLAKGLLIYMVTLAGTSIGGYLWACLKDDAKPPVIK